MAELIPIGGIRCKLMLGFAAVVGVLVLLLAACPLAFRHGQDLAGRAARA